MKDGSKKIVEEWGWMPDFSMGLILEVNLLSAQVYYLDDNLRTPAEEIGWYPMDQLEVLYERR